jgi:predicted dienelactone hydrolase
MRGKCGFSTIAAMVAGLALAPGATPAGAAGFRHIRIPDPGNPPIEANIWYPASVPPRPNALGLQTQMVAAAAPAVGTGLGLIAVSHGTGGNADNHFDTAIALADAGFVVVAPTFTGDSTDDRSRVLMIWNRPRLLHVVLDYMLGTWPERGRIDAHRVGAFGFSAGGFTVLVAAGGTPDLTATTQHCHAHPTDWTCTMIATMRGPNSNPAAPLPPSIWVHDPRIRAAVVAAPALGYSFGKSGLAGVRLALQLWRADDDHILPAPYYADAVAADLPVRPDFHAVPKADHMDFLAPCSDAFAKVVPQICTSAPGFDRVAFHREFDRVVVAFFRKNLPN